MTMRLIFRNPLYGRCGDEASKAVPGDGYPGIRRKATKGAGKSTPEPEPESTATLRGSRQGSVGEHSSRLEGVLRDMLERLETQM